MMLREEHLTCGYGGAPVVRDMGLGLEAGGRLCVLGPNGCGKTTLLRALAGLLPYTGTVTVCGQDAASMDRRALSRRLAMMSQHTAAYFAYTVYETVAMGRYPHRRGVLPGRESERDRAVIRRSMERTGVWPLRDELITRLSGGQLQRVFLARTFAQDAAVILLDEPTNHLDLRYQVELTDFLRVWAQEEERAVVGVLHDVNLALDFARTVLLMEAGTALWQGPAAELPAPLLDRVYAMDVAGYMRRTLGRWA